MHPAPRSARAPCNQAVWPSDAGEYLPRRVHHRAHLHPMLHPLPHGTMPRHCPRTDRTHNRPAGCPAAYRVPPPPPRVRPAPAAAAPPPRPARCESPAPSPVRRCGPDIPAGLRHSSAPGPRCGRAARRPRRTGWPRSARPSGPAGSHSPVPAKCRPDTAHPSCPAAPVAARRPAHRPGYRTRGARWAHSARHRAGTASW